LETVSLEKAFSLQISTLLAVKFLLNLCSPLND
jgi:hypothetical protein